MVVNEEVIEAELALQSGPQVGQGGALAVL